MKLSVEFQTDAGRAHVVEFDTAANTATRDGVTVPAVRAEGSNLVTLHTPEGPLAITIDRMVFEVGESSRFSASNGDAGVARVIAAVA